MALQALLFSKNPETVQSLSTILSEVGIRVESCADIFSAIEKATKQPFPCVIADWIDQPESGFLLKRARESAPNRSTVTIAIVESEFAAKNATESEAKFVFFRPIVPDEIRAVAAKARQQMIIPLGATNVNLRAALAASPRTPEPQAESGDPNLLATAAHLPASVQHYEPIAETGERMVEDDPGESPAGEEIVAEPDRGTSRVRPVFQRIFVTALFAFAAFCLWRNGDAFIYLARTPEGGVHVLKKSVAALFFHDNSGAQSIGSAASEAQQDAYFSRSAATAASQSDVQVVNGEVVIPDSHTLPRAFDLPLPVPEYVHVPVPPPARVYAKVPDSLKNSLPIGPPVIGTVNPAAQMLPVSAPAPTPTQISEPVDLPEDKARALATSVVQPVYPPEAAAQKLHGPVVLQTMIGRDGNVQDVKIVRGYFLLGRAGTAAVKQWKFRPYTFNGVPLSVRTQITLNFSYPPAR